QQHYQDAEISTRQVALVSAIGSDMKVPGMLAKTVGALADAKISILAMHQSMRQVDMQFVIDEADYDRAVQRLHACLVEVHNHGVAICAASDFFICSGISAGYCWRLACFSVVAWRWPTRRQPQGSRQPANVSISYRSRFTTRLLSAMCLMNSNSCVLTWPTSVSNSCNRWWIVMWNPLIRA